MQYLTTSYYVISNEKLGKNMQKRSKKNLDLKLTKDFLLDSALFYYCYENIKYSLISIFSF